VDLATQVSVVDLDAAGKLPLSLLTLPLKNVLHS
jgi:hypothetical protein